MRHRRALAAAAVIALSGAAPAVAGQEEEAPDQGVGGALQSWSSVPIADDATRASGSLHLWGQLQTWATVADQDRDLQADPATYGDPEADPGFSISRARIGFDGFLPMGDRACCGQVDYALSVGIGAPYDALSTVPSGSVQVVDAFGRWAMPWSWGVTSVAAGMQRVPFGREAMMSSARLVFQERGVATNWMTPSREVGAVLGQSVHFGDRGPRALVRAGLYNGNRSLFGDRDPGLMAAARAEFLWGDAYQTWSPDLANAVGVGGALLSNQELAIDTSSREVDLLARFKWVTVMGEVITSHITLGDTTVVAPELLGETNRLGVNGQLSVYVPLPGAGGVEAAGRFSSFDDDRGRTNAGDVQILHTGLTWRDALPGFDLGGGYIHRQEPAAIPNDTVRLWMQVRPSTRL